MKTKNKIFIVTPCYNEKKTVILFLEELEKAVSNIENNFCVVVVNDGSIDETLQYLLDFKFKSSNIELIILDLEQNVGHQGAILQGLKYCDSENAATCIVIDSDGEDDVFSIKDLINQQNREDTDIIHVVRGKRQENLRFKIGYFFYKKLFQIITGKEISFGNFCLLNRKGIVVSARSGFVHFGAFLYKQRLRRAFITSDRRSRLMGESKMNLNSLLYHGFKALTEFSEEFLFIFLKLFLIIILVLVGQTAYIIYEKFIVSRAIPGWTSTMGINLINGALISLGFFVIGLLLLSFNQKSGRHIQNSIFKVIKKEQ